MRRLCTAVLMISVECCGMGLAEAQTNPAADGATSVAERYLFVQANAEREQRGLPLLRWDSSLYKAADFHARQMAARASISHQYAGEPDLADRGHQAGARFSTIAENVAEAPTAVRIHDAWMQSAGHRENLLDERVNAVAIRVLQRDGQLYAVEDFARTVESRSIAEQELAVESLLTTVSAVTVLPTSEDVRRTCSMETGYSGVRKPWFVMRYTTADLQQLPAQLKTQLATGRYREAQIGACTATEERDFSSFRLAVLLYP